MILDTGRNTSFFENQREISYIFRFVSITKRNRIQWNARRSMKSAAEQAVKLLANASGSY